jgi:2-aminoadipate transaminase
MAREAIQIDNASWFDRFADRARVESGNDIAIVLGLASRTDVISFAGGFPDPQSLDRSAVAEIVGELSSGGDTLPFQYGPTRGVDSFRNYVSERLAALERRRVGEDELLITSGGIEAIRLAATVFLEPGDVVVVEAPTYMGARLSFASSGAHLTTVPLEAGGMDVAMLAEQLSAGLRPKLVYTNPDHQNPAGVTQSRERRDALLELAALYGFLIVEDVAYREFTFATQREPSLWSLAPDAVLQIGTFSKIFSPGVRLGWAVGPPAVVDRLTWAKQFTDQCASAFTQRVVEEYGRRGHLDAQVVRATGLYRERCSAMLRCLEAEMPADTTWTRPSGGFFTWLALPPGGDAASVFECGLEAGVAVMPGMSFFPDERGRDHLRICFSRSDIDQIENGVRTLGRVVRQTSQKGARR